MEITCYREPELASEARCLPAAVYNLAHTLLARSKDGCVFVPIRSMQYLAILDNEEFVFVDGASKCWIDVAWRGFRPDLRQSLDEAVAYQAVYYRPGAEQLMVRLQSEFPAALRQLADKGRPEHGARVYKFPAPARP